MTALAAALAALSLDAALEQKLRDFSALFMRWNRSINLSGARDDEALDLHIIDSLHVVPLLRALPHATDAAPPLPPPHVLDVGSGGGLPSLIVALALPSIHITALEPVRKKHAFLRTAARELALPNFEPLAERLEDHALHDYAAATSRATFDLREWLELGARVVRPGGLVLGFEAVPRSDLPAEVLRTSYVLGDRKRSIVAFTRC
ncbi:MAG TPA: 16S rRNA (guanine(527)-N(7))-methyltransferase RsmG [Kofleriaceae bacterium]|nr:16S rRNA (guanine(527)-N(7))-methyltransferase RsmG [Kofleriaceae bacterium]